MTGYMYLATIAWLLLVAGYLARRRRERHVPLVLTGMFMDIGLVMYLQVTRDALQTAASFQLEMWQQMHVAASSAALLLYPAILVMGIILFGDPRRPGIRIWHVRISMTALAFRTAGFALMFSMLQ